MNRLLELLWMQPARIVALSFVLVALVGALLLMLPPAHTDPDGLSFLDAFFTAASAVCVTGLIVVDTPVAFTLFGEIVILILIQIGGLGIMAFSLSAIFLRRKRLSVGESELLSYMLNEEDRTTLRGQLLTIVGLTFLLELIGAVLLYLPMRSAAGEHSAIWLSVFHAVSAFCNAGFSLFSDSLVGFADSFVVNATVSGLILAGGIGFTTLSVFRDDIQAWLRHVIPGDNHSTTPRIFRIPPSWRYIRSESARIALWGTGLLVVLGTVLFYVLESGQILTGETLTGKYIRSLFQSVTLRTAGFNTVDIGALSVATLLMMVPFMFIGAGSGGTAGGVKLGTAAVVLADVKRFVLGREDAVLFHRRVPRRAISEAYVLVVAGIAIVFAALTVLAITEPAPLEVILFEIVSALGTVGLSAGVTGELSGIGKVTVIVLMFLGRLGPLTLVVAFRPRVIPGAVRYPDGNPPIG